MFEFGVKLAFVLKLHLPLWQEDFCLISNSPPTREQLLIVGSSDLKGVGCVWLRHLRGVNTHHHLMIWCVMKWMESARLPVSMRSFFPLSLSLAPLSSFSFFFFCFLLARPFAPPLPGLPHPSLIARPPSPLPPSAFLFHFPFTIAFAPLSFSSGAPALLPPPPHSHGPLHPTPFSLSLSLLSFQSIPPPLISISRLCLTLHTPIASSRC